MGLKTSLYMLCSRRSRCYQKSVTESEPFRKLLELAVGLDPGTMSGAAYARLRRVLDALAAASALAS